MIIIIKIINKKILSSVAKNDIPFFTSVLDLDDDASQLLSDPVNHSNSFMTSQIKRAHSNPSSVPEEAKPNWEEIFPYWTIPMVEPPPHVHLSKMELLSIEKSREQVLKKIYHERRTYIAKYLDCTTDSQREALKQEYISICNSFAGQSDKFQYQVIFNANRRSRAMSLIPQNTNTTNHLNNINMNTNNINMNMNLNNNNNNNNNNNREEGKEKKDDISF